LLILNRFVVRSKSVRYSYRFGSNSTTQVPDNFGMVLLCKKSQFV
jgi:hypothetical protein